MPEGPTESPGRGPVDVELLDRIAGRLSRSARFDDVYARPPYAPTAVVAEYDLGNVPGGVTRASLRIRWFETDDFSIHYAEQYRSGASWECRWDCHPNDHNTREHFHPPPDASTPGEDADYPDDRRDVLANSARQSRRPDRSVLGRIARQQSGPTTCSRITQSWAALDELDGGGVQAGRKPFTELRTSLRRRRGTRLRPIRHENCWP